MPIIPAFFPFGQSGFASKKAFLWVDDLSSYEEAFHLPFKIPMFGDTVSIFAILAAITMFIYMKMNMSAQSSMSMPQQEGMPDMQKMMKLDVLYFTHYDASFSLIDMPPV